MRKIRILICHNTYQQKGGEDTVVKAEKRLLEDNGHEVQLYLVSNDQINNWKDKLKAGLNVSYSVKEKFKLKTFLQQNPVDIVHFHNTFPLLTPSVYEACNELGIPCVQTLHNYRLLCASALLLRNGNLCEKCVVGSPYHAVLHQCYRSSRVQSFASARMISVHRRENTWNNKVDRFIALTQFAKNKFIEAGFESKKISVKPNFSSNILFNKTPSRKPYVLYVGRLSKEKGVEVLVESFNALSIPLKIVGEGDLASQLKAQANNNIEFLGQLASGKVKVMMENAQFLVFPSQCYEGFPLTIVESFASKLPVVAYNLGAMAEIIESGKNGYLVNSNDEFKRMIKRLFDDQALCDDLRENAFQDYLHKYSARKNYQQLYSIYHALL